MVFVGTEKVHVE